MNVDTKGCRVGTYGTSRGSSRAWIKNLAENDGTDRFHPAPWIRRITDRNKATIARTWAMGFYGPLHEMVEY